LPVPIQTYTTIVMNKLDLLILSVCLFENLGIRLQLLLFLLKDLFIFGLLQGELADHFISSTFK
jgi:hypothetical protein